MKGRDATMLRLSPAHVKWTETVVTLVESWMFKAKIWDPFSIYI